MHEYTAEPYTALQPHGVRRTWALSVFDRGEAMYSGDGEAERLFGYDSAHAIGLHVSQLWRSTTDVTVGAHRDGRRAADRQWVTGVRPEGIT
jgi:hypothetical protein